MILTVAELRQYIETEETDAVLEMKLQALESAIQRYTNNDFKRCLTAEGEYPADIKKGIVDMMQWDLTHSAKLQDSTHLFMCDYFDYKALNLTPETSRLLIDGERYDIMLIDDPMGLHQHLEIHLEYLGGQ